MLHRLPRNTPESQGVDSAAILSFLDAVEMEIDELHSIMLVRHGQVIAEGWWTPYAPQHPHMLYSLSKSFTSSAIGLAVQEGRLSVDDKVISFFPDDLPDEVSPNLAAMRVHDLLSMACGHEKDVTDKMFSHPVSLTRGFLAAPVEHAPGTHFAYDSGTTYMLSAIIQKLTGQRLVDYLTPRLFAPLGIEGATWDSSAQGIDYGAFGLNIRTEDIAVFGQMLLQGGVWNGQQILPEAWVKTATSYQVKNGDDPDSDWNQGYGYQFWRCRHNAFRGDGAFGQFCVILPEQDAVVVTTGAVWDMQAVLNLVWKHLLPAMQPAALPADAAAHDVLNLRLKGLEYRPKLGAKTSPLAPKFSKITYHNAARELGIKSFCFDFQPDVCAITVHHANGTAQFECGYSEWRQGDAPIFDHSGLLVASGVWKSDDTFEMTLRFYETPFVNTIACKFSPEQLMLKANVNVSFGPARYEWQGQAAK